MSKPPGRERGQATVELALALPLICLMVLVVVQAGLVVRDQVLLVHAAREGARVAAIDGDHARALAAAGDATALQPERLSGSVTRHGDLITVELRYRSPIVVPVLRRARTDVTLVAVVTMHDESAGSP
jgi:hypothetical protein